jgi:4-amino-4-deoxy-L-arabinose transferase-like glycosyltransferase
LVSFLSGFIQHFNKWRFVLLIFLLVYAVLFSLDLSSAALQWDEMPHLYGGLLLSRGQAQEYIREGSYYPPILDLVTAFFFRILGVSVFSGRLVSVTFGLLCIWCVFEFAYRFYGPWNALLSSILFASMPGFIWLCRLSLIETTLLFFFSVSLVLFFLSIHTNNIKILLPSGVALGVGFLTKYQALVGGLIMLVSIFFVWKERISTKLCKFSLVLIAALVTVLPWIFLTYQIYSSGMLDNWLYSLQMGNAERVLYSTRFPIPIFYLIEMTYPYPYLHPISLPIYILAFAGLGFWLWRRKNADRFCLTWFLVVFIVFTLIPNRNWRFVTLVFPILAVSASDFVLSVWNKAKDNLRARKTSLRQTYITRIVTSVFIFLIVASILYSSRDAYLWIQRDCFHVPVEEASQYVARHLDSNKALIVLCPSNHFSLDMVKFYLKIYNSNQSALWQYPEKAIDAYTPVFNVTELIERSEALHVKYLLLYEYGGLQYFESELTYQKVFETLFATGRFVLEAKFGDNPNMIFIISFVFNSTDTYRP